MRHSLARAEELRASVTPTSLAASFVLFACCTSTIRGQNRWTLLDPGGQETKMSWHGMVYDTSRDRIVRYGGRGSPENATWEWFDGHWVNVSPTVSPPRREGTAMVYDPFRRRTMIFGGQAGSVALDDLWEWDGTSWTEVVTPVRPPPRAHHMMAFDTANRCIVLFGGWDSLGTLYYSDTWTWNGSVWQQQAPAVEPAARLGAGMTYDQWRRRVVMFGGIVPSGTWESDEHWEWDGANWQEIQPALRPARRIDVRLVYDDLRHRVLAFGGEPNDFPRAFSDVWSWDGLRWKLLAATGPPPRAAAGLAYDSRRDVLVIHGGNRPTSMGNPGIYRDTWSFDLRPGLHPFPTPARDRRLIDR